MRKRVNYFINQVSPARKIAFKKPVQTPQLLSSPRIPSYLNPQIRPLASSREILCSMSLRQETSSATNGVMEPLALPGGAPLKVKNSLSKEKVGSIYRPVG
jgi:hypothetical protein